MKRDIRAHILTGLGALVLVLLASACGGDSGDTTIVTTPGADTTLTSTTTSTDSDATVVIDSFTFTPANLTVSVGETVTWENAQGVTHTVTADEGAFDATLSSGDTFEFVPDAPGTYTYFCSIHPSMSGTIEVGG
ncbi:MAG: cupredoxin domain-containing protein [Acidimicrobiia bacterium]|nr:cupredoxin domain-containing protein [Acidimicrobiia bacterium]